VYDPATEQALAYVADGTPDDALAAVPRPTVRSGRGLVVARASVARYCVVPLR